MSQKLSTNAERVLAWQATIRDGSRTVPDLCLRYEAAVNALWRAAAGTISNITLAAIWDRAIFNATERHPDLIALVVGTTTVHFDNYDRIVDGHAPEVIDQAFVGLIAEFVTITGRLTNELLTERLYAALAESPQRPIGRPALPFDPKSLRDKKRGKF